ncbi:MAG: hypothetical protein ABFD89_16880 [Bryobacteraceae bacterium]
MSDGEPQKKGRRGRPIGAKTRSLSQRVAEDGEALRVRLTVKRFRQVMRHERMAMKTAKRACQRP